MKRLLLAAVLAAFTVPSFAGIDEGIDKGMTHLFVLGGAAVPVSEYETIIGDFDIGDTGFTYGAQLMHYLTPAFGLGVEFNGTNFSRKDGLKGDKYSGFVAGKLSFAPAAKTRLYIPLGAGFSNYKVTNANNESAKWTKPAFYAGLGVESDLNDIFLFGFEARYNLWMFDDDKVNADNDYLDDVSLLLKVGIKF